MRCLSWANAAPDHAGRSLERSSGPLASLTARRRKGRNGRAEERDGKVRDKDIRALRRSALSVSVGVPGCQKLQMTVWHRMSFKLHRIEFRVESSKGGGNMAE